MCAEILMHVNDDPSELPLCLERFDGGGVALHLKTGACFRLNEVAVEICEKLSRGLSIEKAALEIAGAFDVSLDKARADIIAIKSALESAKPLKKIEDPLSYEAKPDEHLVLVQGSPALRVDPKNKTLELMGRASPDTIRDAIDGVLPKLLALRNIVTLHASAVEIGGVVRAFSGASGAGKTTTAHAFAAISAKLIAEDVLALRIENGEPLAVLSAERGLRQWGLEAERILDKNPQARIDFTSLDELIQGEALPLASIYFLDANRRKGRSIELLPLAPPDLMVSLLSNVFLASTEPEEWQLSAKMLARVARASEGALATMPRGVDALRAAALEVVERL